MKKLKSILWGLVLIAVGVILALNSFGVTNIDILFDGWWTLFILVPSFISLFDKDERAGGVIGLIIGTVLLLACQNIISFELVLKLALPTVLVILGIVFIFKNIFETKASKKIKELNERLKDEDKYDYVATFSGQKINLKGQKFKGCTMNAIFGGIDIDLSKAIIKEDVVVGATAIFGGINIKLPEGVNVEINSSSFCGGVANKSKATENGKKKVTIYINANCAFGGVELR